MAVGGPSSGPGTTNRVKIFANIFIAFIGAGVLGLPYSFKEAGILEGTFIMSIVGVISVKAMLLLVDCKYRILQMNKRGESMLSMREDGLYANKNGPSTRQERQDLLKDEEQLVTRIKNPKVIATQHTISYGDIGYEAIGSTGRILVDIAIVSSQIGFCCAYLIFITKNLSDFVPSVEMVQWLLMVLPPLTLLTLLRNLNSLAFTSLMAQLSNLFAFGVVFWFDFEHFHEVKIHPREISLENLPFFFVIAIYCYEGAGLVLSLESSLAEEVRHKFAKYFVSVLAVCTSLYIAFGICGYLSFGPETNQIITLNLPKGEGLDFSMLVKSCLCVALFCTYPVMMFPVMSILEHYFIPDAHTTFWKGNVLRGMVVLLTGMVVMVIPNFADLMALVGATCCTLLAFIMPGLFHMKLFHGDLTGKQKLFDWLLIFLGVLGTVLGLWDAMGRISEPEEEIISPTIPSEVVSLANDIAANISSSIAAAVNSSVPVIGTEIALGVTAAPAVVAAAAAGIAKGSGNSLNTTVLLGPTALGGQKLAQNLSPSGSGIDQGSGVPFNSTIVSRPPAFGGQKVSPNLTSPVASTLTASNNVGSSPLLSTLTSSSSVSVNKQSLSSIGASSQLASVKARQSENLADSGRRIQSKPSLTQSRMNPSNSVQNGAKVNNAGSIAQSDNGAENVAAKVVEKLKSTKRS